MAMMINDQNSAWMARIRKITFQEQYPEKEKGKD
jgi:hypothetical protein